MKNGKVIIINGTSSSGKTSLLINLQNALHEPYLNCGIDKFIWMLPKRYLDQPLWDDVLGMANHAGQTGERLVVGMHAAIKTLAESGWNVIADHVLVEERWAQDCARRFANLPIYMIGLFCPLEVLEERERSRKDRTLGQARLQYPVIHKHCIYDLELDSSKLSLDACAKKVLDRMKSPPEAISRMFEML